MRNPMCIPLQPFLSQKVSFADLFERALSRPRALERLLDEALLEERGLRRLQQAQAGPIVLDLGYADGDLSNEEVESITRTIREHWHEHGFCLVASADPALWRKAASRQNQPFLHWHDTRPHVRWDLLGYQFRVHEREAFRLLAAQGRVSVDQIARNPLIFSQLPNFADGRVITDLLLGRPIDPTLSNRSQAQSLLRQMRERRLVVEGGYFYSIVRPERDLLAQLQKRRE